MLLLPHIKPHNFIWDASKTGCEQVAQKNKDYDYNLLSNFNVKLNMYSFIILSNSHLHIYLPLKVCNHHDILFLFLPIDDI